MPKPMPPSDRPLAWHLGALCAALLAPMLVLGLLLLLHTADAERARHEEVARDAASRIATTLDRGLTTYQAMLDVLATSGYLHTANFAGFHRRATEVPRPAGAEIVLRDVAGRVLADTGAEVDAPPVHRPLSEADHRAIVTGRPQISHLAGISDLNGGGIPSGMPEFAVITPVRDLDGEAAYLLSLIVPATVLAEVLRREAMPEGTVASLVDRSGRMVARSAEPGRFIGMPLTPGVQEQLASREEGWLRTRMGDGTPMVAAFARSAVSGWTSMIALPEAVFTAPLRRSLLVAAVLGALIAALAALLAHGFARRIARPIEALAGTLDQNGNQNGDQGRSRAAGQPGGAAPLATPVREVNAVGRALAAAQEDSRRRATEREALLQTLDLAQVLVRAPDGTITLWTSGMERLFGWSRAEALGRRSHTLLATGFPRPRAEIEMALLAHGEWRGELHQRRADGAPLVIATHWALRRGPDGEALAVVEACNDITARRSAEAQLRETQAELFRVARLNSMGAMAAALAHELNQPLTAAANFTAAAGLFLADAGPRDAAGLAATRTALADAAGEVVRAGQIVQRLREFIGRGDTEKRLADINDIVEKATSLALAGTPEPGVTLHLALAADPPPVLADAVQLQQVLVNLVRNAVEAMRGAARRELRVTTAVRAPDAVEVSVADTGPGLAADLDGRLFEPFVTTKPDGMGIGLSISRSIVEGHGGQLEMAARPGGGTVFRCILPTLPAEPPDDPREEETADAG
jgi:two-component system sensor kinase FixL